MPVQMIAIAEYLRSAGQRIFQSAAAVKQRDLVAALDQALDQRRTEEARPPRASTRTKPA